MQTARVRLTYDGKDAVISAHAFGVEKNDQEFVHGIGKRPMDVAWIRSVFASAVKQILMRDKLLQ